MVVRLCIVGLCVVLGHLLLVEESSRVFASPLNKTDVRLVLKIDGRLLRLFGLYLANKCGASNLAMH